MEKNLKEKIENLNKDLEKFSAPKTKQNNEALRAERVLAELVAGLIFGVFVGYQLDKYFETKPLFLIILIILGLAGSFYNIYKQVSKN
ncbi:MAG: AtpZ/AtpI family protein [Rickettsiales bacterium]|nr:AtpZ/AtpI family protein [Rickettsiales bacterium]